MSFMQPFVTDKQTWHKIDGQEGIVYFPGDIFSFEGALLEYGLSSYWKDECATIEGYGARLSAPGYMDCTEWSVFDTEAEAEAYLQEQYPEAFEEDEPNHEPDDFEHNIDDAGDND